MELMLRTLRELLERDPFAPFQIVMSSGDRFNVENPSLVVLDEGYVLYYLPRSNNQAYLRLNQIALFQVDRSQG